MPNIAPIIIREDQDVESALNKIGLTRDVVIKVALSAAAARAESLAVDPLSAPGTFSYIHGVRVIRLNLLKQGWRLSRQGNVESTINDKLGVQLCFQNVDVACSEDKNPHAISGKGTASRNLVDAGQIELFDPSPSANSGASLLGTSPTVWLICVSVEGFSVRAEVSCPKSFEGSQFEDFHQRIFVLDEDFEPNPTHNSDDNEDIDDFDIEISKK